MKNKSSWILLLVSLLFLFGVIYYNNHQADFSVKKAHRCFKKNNIACTQNNLEKAFKLGVKSKPERELYLNTIITSPLDIKAQEKLMKFRNLDVDDELTLKANSFIYDFRRAINEKYVDNYIMQAVLNQKIVRWGQMPVTYSFETTDKELPDYYKEEIETAFSEWSKATDFKISFAKGDENSNIKIFFNHHNPAESDDKKYIVAYTTPNVNGKTLKSMSMIFYTQDPNGNYYTKNQVYNTALHEIAHALGVMGHSNNKENVMYLTKDDTTTFDDARAELSISDINTMKLLYKIKPDITNFEDKESEFIPFLILGDDSDVISAKINEAKFYIRRNPQIPNGYMDLAEAYVGLGEYSKAIKCLEKGYEYASTKVLREMINFNLAICNYHLENFILAEEFIKRALYIKESERARFLLANIYIDSNQIEKAKKELEILRKNYPQNVEYAICLANIYLKDKEYLKTRKVLKDFIKQNPDEKGNPRFDAYGFLKIGL